jgi:hypothetical protein
VSTPRADDRDRDLAGRARNARPRDALGRPLPREATAAEGAVLPIPDDLDLPPDETLTQAQRLLDGGRAFSAHEVLEAAWKSAPATERDLWQGLAQLAVGLTHLQRGNHKGAVTLLRRGVARLRPYAAAPPHRVDVTGVIAWADAAAADPTQAPSTLRLGANPGPPPD